MCQVSRRCSRSLRLTFCRVYPDPNCPRDAEYCHEYVDCEDDYPTANTGMAMNGVSCVEPTYQEHRHAESETTIYSTLPSTPFVGKEEARNGHEEDDCRRNCRREKRSIRRGKASLFEKKRCVLDIMSILPRKSYRQKTKRAYIENAINSAELLHTEQENRQSSTPAYISSKYIEKALPG